MIRRRRGLAMLDLSAFDAEAPPMTQAFSAIVATRAPEEAERRRPRCPAIQRVTIGDVLTTATGGLVEWLNDRKNRRAIPHRMEQCGYVQVRNDTAKSGLWVVNGNRQVIYALRTLLPSARIAAARALVARKQ